jgi:hypothetical protein
MLAATFLAIFFVPLFFVLIRRLGERMKGRSAKFPAEDRAEPVLEGDS